MAKYLNKEMFLQSMGLLGDETKYGNRDGEHQSRSYGAWMGYEIMDSVEDSIVEEDVVEVVHCSECTKSGCCIIEERLVTARAKDRYCGLGERKDNG